MKYAIIADIHEDIVNLKFALGKIEKHNCHEIICLGDVSGFSAPHYNYYDTRNAHECLKLVRQSCKTVIAGNHDLHAAKITPKTSPNFKYPKLWYKMDYYERLNLSAGQVWLYSNDELDPLYSHADIEFLHTLPEYHILETNKHKILLSHFIYPNLTGSSREFYSFADDFELHKEYMENSGCQFGFAGHRHFTGLLIASDKGMVEKRYNSKYTPKPNDCILVPPITGARNGNGFCIFDSENLTIEAKRI